MKRFSIFLLSVFVTAIIACETAPPKKEVVKEVPKEVPKVDTTAVFVNSSNEQLANYPVAGFAYKSHKVPKQQWDEFAKNAAPIIKGILDKLPGGYVLQVTGHADSRGPEEPEGRKPGNIKISSDRAKAVHGALVKNGITSPNMIYKGVGSSDPLSGVDGEDASQRRVTFKIMPQ